MDRVADFESEGRGFDSLWAHHKRLYSKLYRNVELAIFYDKALINDSRFDVMANEENKKVIKCKKIHNS